MQYIKDELFEKYATLPETPTLQPQETAPAARSTKNISKLVATVSPLAREYKPKFPANRVKKVSRQLFPLGDPTWRSHFTGSAEIKIDPEEMMRD